MLPILPALATRRGDTNIGALHDFSGARTESWHPRTPTLARGGGRYQAARVMEVRWHL
jgi:hypothetical protein